MEKIKENKNVKTYNSTKKACDIFPANFDEMNIFLYGKK